MGIKPTSGRRAVLPAAGLALGAATWFRRERNHRPVLPPSVEARPEWLQTSLGRIAWYESGDGPPLLLVHDFNATASAYEIRPLFERLARAGRRVLAFDWLGFGLSDRPKIEYRPVRYRALFREILDNKVNEAIDVVALSVSSEYLARLAVEQPGRFRSLVLISPTGIGRTAGTATLPERLFNTVVRRSMAGEYVFRLLTARFAIGWYLRHVFAEPDRVPAGFIEHCWRTAHQEGDRFAPLAAVTGALDDPRASEYYRALRIPTLMLFGDQSRLSNPKRARRLLAGNRSITIRSVRKSGDLPHFEQPEETANAVTRYFREQAPTEETR